MSSSVYCLLSYGDLKFLPFESHISITDVLQKENDKLPYLPQTLQVSGLSSPSISSSSSIKLSSPTPDILDLNSDSLNELNHSAHSVYLRDDYVNISTEDTATNSLLKTQVFKLISIIFPTWSSDSVKVKQLTGGITNMLLSLTNSESSQTVLVRTYGQGTSVIIDRDREFVTQLSLHSLGLAAPIYARFGNGLVYGFISGRALTPDELSNEKLYPLIAQLLGHWHAVMKGEDIYEGILKLKQLRGESNVREKVTNNLWDLILDWIKVLPDIDSLLDKCLQYQDILECQNHGKNLKQILNEELEWMVENISDKSPIALCHCDLLSGNVIIPDELSEILANDEPIPDTMKDSNPISFIDYEYAFPLPRAFDISNHFMEWQGFECDKTKIPVPLKDNTTMRNWTRLYLSSDGHKVSESEIDGLIEEIGIFYGLPGFYWGIWAAIQSTISIIDFDYKNYCCQRLDEYFTWKLKYMNK